MDWLRLISNKRLGQETRHPLRHDDRSEFKRDGDRLIYSAPFRRLQNKTQVFPLPVGLCPQPTDPLLGGIIAGKVAGRRRGTHPHGSTPSPPRDTFRGDWYDSADCRTCPRHGQSSFRP